jgi:quercetin dioxygenase-like cupin family protein
MKTTRFVAATLLIAGSGLVLHAAHAEWTGIHRTDLIKNALSAPGHEVVQVRVDFEPGVASSKHAHPGAEVAYVLEGALEYQLEGRPPVTLKAGEALFIPDGTAHVAKNVGNGKASELATYVVRSGAPLVANIK